MRDIPTLLDHKAIDWSTVERTSYLIHQQLRYEYPGPIHDLRQRLVIVPPDVHGGQRLLDYELEVSVPRARMQTEIDRFGNRVYVVDVPYVEQAVQFEACISVERVTTLTHTPCAPAQVPLYLAPTTLTKPDTAIQEAARDLRRAQLGGLELANAINSWVYRALSYTPDVTGVRTTASQALALGKGVCQDYAHIMLAICRLCGIPARYVSGHLLGEGGTHAWVEVIVPDQQMEGSVMAVAFDPTHDRRATPSYITVAVGREYGDVAPTSGTFRAPYSGQLVARKRAGLVSVQQRDGAAA